VSPPRPEERKMYAGGGKQKGKKEKHHMTNRQEGTIPSKGRKKPTSRGGGTKSEILSRASQWEGSKMPRLETRGETKIPHCGTIHKGENRGSKQMR